MTPSQPVPLANGSRPLSFHLWQLLDGQLPFASWPPLLADEVHVWRAGLDLFPEQLAQMLPWLSTAERARMARFRFDLHRFRYAAAHGQLRFILSHYLNLSPAAIRFQEGAHGKPYQTDEPAVQFNLAHAEDQMLLGVVRGRAIGVDIEAINHRTDTEAIAGNYFSLAEQEAFAALPAAEKNRAFYHAWARKEAFIKAVGDGLSYPLAQFVVSVSPHEEARLLAVDGSAAAAAAWHLQAIDVGERYAAAVVVATLPE